MIALGFASYLAFGVVLVLLGANQADLARALDLDLTRTGLLAAVLSAGLGVGVVGSGPLLDRFPRKPLYLGSMALSAGALFGFEPDMSFAQALICCGLLGLGIGVYDNLVSVVVVERDHGTAPRAMAFVHAGATLGAVLCPLLVSWIAARWGWAASFHGTGAAHLVLAAACLAVAFPRPPNRSAQPRERRIGPAELAPFAAISFAYVGFEAALTLFTVPYATGLGLEASRGLEAISAFWLGLLLGRLAFLALRRSDPGLLVAAGLAGAALLGGGALLGLRAVQLHLGLTGVSLGFVFPLMVALVGQRFPDARATAIGLVIGAGAVGGFVVPWLHGALGDAFGAPLAVGSLAFWALAVAVFAACASRASQSAASSSPLPSA